MTLYIQSFRTGASPSDTVQAGDISTLEGTSLKLVDKFTYLGSSVSSTEKNIDTQLTKAWTTFDHMEIRPDR